MTGRSVAPSAGVVLRRLVVTAVAAVTTLSACGGGGGAEEAGVDDATRQKLIDAMVSEGAPKENAECIVDGLGNDAERLWTADDADLSDEEKDRFTAVVEKC